MVNGVDIIGIDQHSQLLKVTPFGQRLIHSGHYFLYWPRIIKALGLYPDLKLLNLSFTGYMLNTFCFNTVGSRHTFPAKQRAELHRIPCSGSGKNPKTNETPGNATVVDPSTRDASRSNWGAPEMA